MSDGRDDPSTRARNESTTFLPTPKQIKFIPSEGQPHTKRRRINAACLTCRRRKTRCSGERPVCRTCSDNGHNCAGYAPRASMTRADSEDDDDSAGHSPGLHKTKTEATDKLENRPELPTHESNISERSIPDFRSPESVQTVQSSTVTGHRVPFFRYFGPTAIVPGFKQMVVQIKDRDHRKSTHSESPASAQASEAVSGLGRDGPFTAEVALYDANDPGPNSPLITHLCETFFTNLGCNYPFLQRDRFMKDLGEKRVDAILVDAVCAIAARFSNNRSLSKPSDVTSTHLDERGEVKRAFRGQPYAQRAASLLVDTFGCPTIAVSQACLLLAYEEFGTDRDSGLWMFLGTSIRMAQDLGIQKLEGMQLEGRMGPTPKTVKAHGDEGKSEEQHREATQVKLTQALIEKGEGDVLEDRRASEAERVDTFWAIFFLDRAVSSGVGRPVTLRSKDIEISFPYRPDETMISGYPHPFPVMIRIVHLYGRIADVINRIQASSELDNEGMKKLTAMEKDLTGIYQRMSSKLHFNATNFQHYVKAEQGTNFILLHFWFHTSIILLHQPTLLYSLDSKIQQLFPDSRELSMSSAKTIADILAFAELIDIKSFCGNPFTSQPMYVAACAFLAEVRAHASQPGSRQVTPGKKEEMKPELKSLDSEKQLLDAKIAAKHSLLATAANQNYQRCYKALKILDSYWAGCRYILTALDQKSKGLLDPILYTQEDIDGEMPSIEPSFTQPGWRRSSHGPSPSARRTSIPWSPRMDWSNQAIGWSLTGTTNSPAPNLSFLYPAAASDDKSGGHFQFHAKQQPMRQQTGTHQRPEMANYSAAASRPMMPPPPQQRSSILPYDPVSAADADLLLGLHSPYNLPTGQLPTQQAATPGSAQFDYPATSLHQGVQAQGSYYTPTDPSSGTPGYADMLIESQDIDISHQFQGQPGFDNLSFPGGDTIWLEYLPQDVLNYFHQPDDPHETHVVGPGHLNDIPPNEH